MNFVKKVTMTESETVKDDIFVFNSDVHVLTNC